MFDLLHTILFGLLNLSVGIMIGAMLESLGE